MIVSDEVQLVIDRYNEQLLETKAYALDDEIFGRVDKLLNNNSQLEAFVIWLVEVTTDSSERNIPISKLVIDLEHLFATIEDFVEQEFYVNLQMLKDIHLQEMSYEDYKDV